MRKEWKLLPMTLLLGVASAQGPHDEPQPAVVTPPSTVQASPKTSVPLAPKADALKKAWKTTITSSLGLSGVFNIYNVQLIGQRFATPKNGAMVNGSVIKGTFTRNGKHVILLVSSLGKHRYTVTIQP